MAIKYGFFNSVDGDRRYTAEDFCRFLQGIVRSGVYADRSDSLQVFANGDLTVTVQEGRAMLDCHYMENDEPLTLTLSPGGTQDRSDAVVMRLDLDERTCSIYVKEGAPNGSPALTRAGNVQEWMLALVYVPKLATAVTQSNVTDTRSNTGLCGWVTGVIDQVDTSTLYAQMEADLKEKSAKFDAWMADLASPVPFQESTDHPGCLCRIQDGETEWLVLPPLEDRVEYRTVERGVGGQPVYVMSLFFHMYDGTGIFDAQTMQIPMEVDNFHLVSVTGFYTLGGPSGYDSIRYLIPDGSTHVYKNIAEQGVFTLNISTAYTIHEMQLVVKYTKI